MSELKKKDRKRSSKPNRNVATLQATVLIYLFYHAFALQDHLITACKTNANYLNNYILPYLLKLKQIQKETSRNTKSYRLSDKGRNFASELIDNIEKKTSIGTSIYLAGIDLELLRRL